MTLVMNSLSRAYRLGCLFRSTRSRWLWEVDL